MRYATGSILLLAVVTTAAPMEFYVARNGNDAWSGQRSRPTILKKDGPFATLERARDAVRALRAQGTFPNQGVRINVREGVYELAETFALTEEDSGTADAPVVYRAFRDEAVHLSGGRIIEELSPVTDPAILQRLDPAARGQVWQADLTAAGIDSFGSAAGGGLEVFVNDEPMPLSRYPNDGFITITGESERDRKDTRGRTGSKYGEIWFEDPRASRWTAEADLWVHGYWFWDWSDQRHKVKELDPAEGRMLFQEPFHNYGYRKGQWFYVYNALSEIDRPGEWHLDRATGTLTIWLPEDRKNTRVMVSVLPTVVSLAKVSHLTLEGFIIEGARGTAIVADGLTDGALKGCTIRNVGGWAVRLSGKDSQVVGCDMLNLGQGGVALSGGDRTTLTKANLVAENNHIHHFSRWTRVYQPGISLSGVGNVARHNLIHNAPHMAMGFSGNDHLIEFNEIHSVCYESNDAGAIYTGRDWTQRGTVMRHNYLHHISGFRGKGCVGIYLDDMYSGTSMIANVFYKVTRATFIGGGRDNVIENNLFINCQPAVHVDARAVGWAKAAVQGVMKERLESSPYKTEIWRERWPELLTLMENDPGLPKGNRIVRNVSYGGTWNGIQPAARPHCVIENNLIGVDPGFVDAENQKWSLKEDSPAYSRIGFKPIPFQRIGLYDGSSRAAWPVKHTVRPMEGVFAEDEPFATAERPTHEVERVAEGRITVDGKSDDWHTDPEKAITCSVPVGGLGSTSITKAWAAFDGHDLYLLVEVPVNPDVPLTTGETWGQEDAVEIAFRNDAQAAAAILNLRGFPTGRSTSVTDAGAPKELAEGLGKAVSFAATVDEDRWTGEWRIPLQAAGMDHKTVEHIAFNINTRRMADRTWMVWAGTHGPIWQVGSAGVLLLPTEK